ncbi:UNVERIFIED_CONTAM: Aplp2 [Trichonephila clavipes]
MREGYCAKEESRWYYDIETGTCYRFVYTGCAGNGNNFKSEDECESRCLTACDKSVYVFGTRIFDNISTFTFYTTA